MFAFKKNYFLLIESTKDLDLKKIKKRSKFIIIYRNNSKREKISKLIAFRKVCKIKDILFYVANDTHLAVNLRSDGIYLSSFNKSFKSLNLKRCKFNIIGAAHNVREIHHKKSQGCEYILLSRLFKVEYKKEMNFLGINKFNYFTKRFKNLVPLGGINILNLNKMKSINSNSFAILTEIKKKPAIISRLF